jgi:hypothetical protein
MNAGKKAELAGELVRLRASLLDVEACAGMVDTAQLILLPTQPFPGAPIHVPAFGKAAKALKTQNKVLERLTMILEDVVGEC